MPEYARVMTETPAAHDNPSRLGRFIQNYPGFFPSFLKKQMVAALEKRGDRFQKAFVGRLARARRDRANPPPMIKKQNFCTSESVDGSASSELNE